MYKLASSTHDTIHLVGNCLTCLCFAHEHDRSSIMNMSTKGSRFLMNMLRSKDTMKIPKLKFDRVHLSRRIKNITERLKPVCAKVSTILNLEFLESNNSIGQYIAISLNAEFSRKPGHTPILTSSFASNRPITTPEFIEPKFYGRMDESNTIVRDITQGEYHDKDLTVIPIVGPGGIGKTTLTQHLYKEVQNHFDVKVWICISLNFNVYILKEEIAKSIPKVHAEKNGGGLDDLIEQRLKSKKFLLVLDDIWNCGTEDEWKRLLAPLRKAQTKGNIILVTTRIPVVGEMVKTIDSPIYLEGLKPDEFWNLFQAYAFGDEKSINDHAYLQETGKMIAKKLKGSPLAAKTVGRLLKNHLDLDHWTSVLESKEWELQTGGNDIMPALKLSYDYLPFHLQQYFTYCALFPEDYRYDTDEIVHLWIGLDILHLQGQNKKIEDTGMSYLTDLVNYGFLKKDEKRDGSPCYVMHDLLHELAQKISLYECLAISSSNVRAMQILPSIRHLSIVIDDMDVNDRATFENIKKDFSLLNDRLDVEKLQSVMLFGRYNGTKALRVILLSTASYAVGNIFPNFSNLVHLRYLRITGGYFPELRIPNTISRFYHLRILDVRQCSGHFGLPRDMDNLVSLRHFLDPDDNLHSEIANRRMKQSFFKKVTYTENEQVLENLKPHSNLRELHIKGHGGATCPSWLGVNLSIKDLNSLGLHGVDWKKFPPLGELWLVDKHGEESLTYIENQKFRNLKRLELIDIPILVKWAGNDACCVFSLLEVLLVRDCPELMDLPFRHSTFPRSGQEMDNTQIPTLKELEIVNCPKLSSLPPIPWTSSPCRALIEEVGSDFQRLNYSTNNQSELCLRVEGKDGHQDSAFWKAVAFGNLTELKRLYLKKCLPLPLEHLLMLSCLRRLTIHGSSNVLSHFEAETTISYQFPVEQVEMSHFPKLLVFQVEDCKNIRGIGLAEQTTGMLVSSLSPCGNKLEEAPFGQEQQRGEDEKAAVDDELLLLPHQLERLTIRGISELILQYDSLQDETAGGQRGTCSLRSQAIYDWPNFPLSYSSLSSCFPFPSSLHHVYLNGVGSMETLAPFSNLSSLTRLIIWNGGDLRGEALCSLLDHGQLTGLRIHKTPKFFVGCDPSRLQELQTDDIAHVLAAPIYSLLSSSLTMLTIGFNYEVERFTKEQSEALLLLSSLQHLVFRYCDKLQSLPSGLYRLTSLKRLVIFECPAIRSLPKGGLPNSLEVLDVHESKNEDLKRQCRKLRGTIPIIKDRYFGTYLSAVGVKSLKGVKKAAGYKEHSPHPCLVKFAACSIRYL
uniref:Uncharacterized protein n=1 Tax=Leersia perrieri TaxID=77586 RepID=A0A0D9WTY9_9ORYZ